MKIRLSIGLFAAMIALAIASADIANARGGRGGGLAGARGGGGFSGGGARPSVGSSPSFNRPSGGATRPTTSNMRPNAGGSFGSGGNRPSTLPANRPGGSVGSNSRPSTLPTIQPGSRPGIGAGQGISNRPASGNTINNNRVNISQQPVRLPGLGTGTVGSRLPNQGAGLQNQMANRPQTLDERRSNLSDRMSSGREDWQSHRQDMQGNRQDWRSGNREDWQNWADGNIHHHGGWYHDCWHGGWYPGAGWGYMWNHYPVATAFGLTAWGVNRVAYGWGYWSYSNPYYYSGSGAYDYSQPLVINVNSGNTTTVVSNSADTADQTPPAPDADGMAAFDEAREAFHNGNYMGALAKLDTTLKAMPNDTVVHEFHGLVLFALRKYPESAAAVYAVLSAGPGWDWTTMSGLYPSVDVYTKQLRSLEEFAKANPRSADAHFLLGYHYLICNYAENALKQFKLAQTQMPEDRLLKQLVEMTTPPDESKKSDTPPPESASVPPEKLLKSEQFTGKWKATRQDMTFELDLLKDGSFIWTYTRGKEKQSVTGVFAVDQNNLALETTDGGGTMLAEVDFISPSQFQFKMIGDEKDPGLQFKKI